MEMLNDMADIKEKGGWNTPAWKEAVDLYLRMLAPVAPHISEELWARLGKPYSIHQQSWPKYDEAAAVEDEIELVIQINGKMRDKIVVPADVNEAQAREMALSREIVQKALAGKEPRKVIYVPGRLINIVG